MIYGKETWKEIRSQIVDWEGKIGNLSREEALKPEELIKEINKHNKTASKEEKIISNQSYRKNYKLISGASSEPWSFFWKRNMERDPLSNC